MLSTVVYIEGQVSANIIVIIICSQTSVISCEYLFKLSSYIVLFQYVIETHASDFDT